MTRPAGPPATPPASPLVGVPLLLEDLAEARYWREHHTDEVQELLGNLAEVYGMTVDDAQARFDPGPMTPAERLAVEDDLDLAEAMDYLEDLAADELLDDLRRDDPAEYAATMAVRVQGVARILDDLRRQDSTLHAQLMAAQTAATPTPLNTTENTP